MIKKSLKIIVLVFGVWLMSLITVLKDEQSGSLLMLSDNEIYQQALEAITDKYQKQTDNVSIFKTWSSLKSVETKSSIDLVSVVKNYDISPGADGNGVFLNTDIRKSLKYLVQRGWNEHAFNQFVSDLIPLNRSLLDVRDDWCKHQTYSKDLPQVTVVICFYNEARSTLLRTMYSVLNRSPPHLLEKIILYDDFSTMSHLKEPLEDYIRKVPKVFLKRASHRVGLIRARILAMKEVTTPAVIFLDSHCEVTEGWLEPLLDRITQDPTIVASPIVDDIHDSTFEYIAQDINEIFIGGFNWELKFKWKPIPSEILQKRKNLAAPIKTPTISGGLFAINREFFKKLGYYDDGFDIWGAENLELSFKTWMCGGSLEIVPCSHVGHVFRRRFPYMGQKEAMRRNAVRLAEVWMDEYAQYYYNTIGKDMPYIGNITKRIQLRKDLQCKSFKWYLDNVYPWLDIPDRHVASGQCFLMAQKTFYNLNTKVTYYLYYQHTAQTTGWIGFEFGMQIYSLSRHPVCFDASVSENIWELNILPCHHEGGNQYWHYTTDGEIKREDKCLEYYSSVIVTNFCRGRIGSQIWVYDAKTKHIRNWDNKKCIEVKAYANKKFRATLETCSWAKSQQWEMENYRASRLSQKLRI